MKKQNKPINKNIVTMNNQKTNSTQKNIFSNKNLNIFLTLEIIAIVILFLFPQNPYSFYINTLPPSPFLARVYMAFVFSIIFVYLLFIKKIQTKNTSPQHQFLLLCLFISQLLWLCVLVVYPNKNNIFYFLVFTGNIILNFLSFFISLKIRFSAFKKHSKTENFFKDLSLKAYIVSFIGIVVFGYLFQFFLSVIPSFLFLLITTLVYMVIFFFAGHSFGKYSYKDTLKNQQ